MTIMITCFNIWWNVVQSPCLQAAKKISSLSITLSIRIRMVKIRMVRIRITISMWLGSIVCFQCDQDLDNDYVWRNSYPRPSQLNCQEGFDQDSLQLVCSQFKAPQIKFVVSMFPCLDNVATPAFSTVLFARLWLWLFYKSLRFVCLPSLCSAESSSLCFWIILPLFSCPTGALQWRVFLSPIFILIFSRSAQCLSVTQDRNYNCNLLKQCT